VLLPHKIYRKVCLMATQVQGEAKVSAPPVARFSQSMGEAGMVSVAIFRMDGVHGPFYSLSAPQKSKRDPVTKKWSNNSITTAAQCILAAACYQAASLWMDANPLARPQTRTPQAPQTPEAPPFGAPGSTPLDDEVPF